MPLPANPQLFIGNQATGSASAIVIQDVGVEAAREPSAPGRRR
jgi:hypothetical protein